jgi:hypothetical protein
MNPAAAKSRAPVCLLGRTLGSLATAIATSRFWYYSLTQSLSGATSGAVHGNCVTLAVAPALRLRLREA